MIEEKVSGDRTITTRAATMGATAMVETLMAAIHFQGGNNGSSNQHHRGGNNVRSNNQDRDGGRRDRQGDGR